MKESSSTVEQDEVIREVTETFHRRSQVGIEKYGLTLADNLKPNYIKEAKEEAMDLVNYLTSFESQFRKFIAMHPNDAELGAKIREIYG